MQFLQNREEQQMVVRRMIILVAVTCLSFTASSINFFSNGYQSIASYMMPFVNREQVESGIELWLKQNPEYHNYDEWRNLLVSREHHKYKVDTVRLDKSIEEFKKNNYSLDAWKHKGYIIYDPLTSTYYPVMALIGNGFLLAGCDVCVMNICFSDGRSAGLNELSKAEIKEALSNFKKNILPEIKKYVKKAKQ